MSYRCAILDDYQNVALTLADWSRLKDRVAVDVFTAPFADQASAIAALQGFDIVCMMRERTPFPRSTLEALPGLKLLLTSGMRNAAIDLEAATARGITVCGTGAAGDSTAELTIALMLELARRVGTEHARMQAGEAWQSTLGTALAGKTLGLLGLGKLGGRVAAIAGAIGMPLIAWSQNLTPERCAEVGATLVSREELLGRADVVSIHLQLSSRTRGLVGAAELALMKPNAWLVNTSRGPIVDEPALVAALRERRIAGAGLDVFDVEPLPRDHPLRGLDNAVITPHLGYVTQENYRVFYGQMVEDIEAWLAGSPLRVLTAK